MRHFHSATKALFIAAIFVIATFAANNASAQTAATASNVPASATIASAMGITKTVNLSFGSVSPAAGSTSTLILDESDGRSVAGGAALVAGGTVTSASFDVTGDTSATYAIFVHCYILFALFPIAPGRTDRLVFRLSVRIFPNRPENVPVRITLSCSQS